MMPNYPFHSEDAYMENALPLVSFIDPPHEVTEEERNRPRYGRPVRKPNTDTPTNSDTPTDTQTPPPAES